MAQILEASSDLQLIVSEEEQKLIETNNNESAKSIISSNSRKSTNKFLDQGSFSINWNEPPFPIDNNTDCTIESIDMPKPITVDNSTFTDPYDFNVAYLGGIDGFKVIDAVNRNINDPNLRKINSQLI